MEEKKKSGLATAGLILGIIGICTSFIPIINNISFVLGLIGAIMGIIALIKKTGKNQAIAGIVLCILAVIITVNSQKALTDTLNEVSTNLDKATGSSTEEVLKNDVNVELGNFEVTEDNYGLVNTKLTVKVTNKTGEKKSFNLHIEAVDVSGARIDEDYVYANGLASGQSQNFDIFAFVSSDKIDAMKNATFKIVEASVY
uniref:Uncharacterized protein n=2 Tax=unclassified Caudoviricetes TaxID=2788787 RepID=A0A8S5QGN9_9CAUD|nr:MAG TPA: protein of unknown function (DUF4190) [Siphoviridae sp. ctMkg9]DAE17933.1 MAG TPA: protein of unknown function (DUF4190) [Siphoviridae sp. ctRBF36]